MKARRWLIVAGMVGLVIVIGAVMALVGGGDDRPVSTGATVEPTTVTTATSVPEPATTTTTLATTTMTEPPTTVGPTAADDLAPFLLAASELDGRLKGAAAAINASITETELVVDRATVDLVQETRRQIEVVEAAIPAGMEPELLRSTLLVFSDLVSRSYAMSHWDWPQPPGYETVPLVETNALWCLGNGSEAAARYPSDLAALRAEARSMAPVSTVGPDSAAARDLAVRTATIVNANSCCDVCGGVVVGDLAEITYLDDPLVDPLTGDRIDGDIDGAPFQADYRDGVGWTVSVFVG
jgi:hypothetical protein